MQYYVIWDDGQKFGPADVSVLNQWATENRINPNTQPESVVDGSRVPAKDVPGIIFAQGAVPMQPAQPAQPVQSVDPVQPVTPVASDPFQTQPATPAADPTPVTPAAAASAERYWVVGQDGQKYGPADVPTLSSWATENRLTPTTQLEGEMSGQRVMASAVAGIMFPAAMGAAAATSVTPAASPYGSTESSAAGQSSYAQYPRDFGSSDPDAGKTETIVSFVLSGIGLVCCCFGWIGAPLPIGAVVLAILGKKKGYATAKTALTIAIIVATLWLLWSIGATVFQGQILEWAETMQQQQNR